MTRRSDNEDVLPSRFLHVVRRGMDRASTTWFLDLAEELLDVTELAGSDQRLALTATTNHRLAFNINQRYVLVYHYHQQNLVHFIVAHELVAHGDIRRQAVHMERFRARPNESADEAPYLVGFAGPFDPDSIDGLRYAWHEAARREMRRARASIFRRHHDDCFHRAAVDHDYRDHVLDLAFAQSPR